MTSPIANVTLFSMPTLITRQRENLGRTRSRGVEIEGETRPHDHWRLSMAYLFADARVVTFPGNSTLESLMIPQVPGHQFTFQTGYANPKLLTLGLQGRASSSQFDDDQNLFRLGSYFTMDVFASRRLTHGLEAFVAAENVFNERYEVGKTPVTTLGPPILIRGGVRVHVGSK
ncbi:MAG: TonB-dependent receptor domain-containing protein [Pyrinomonadaceae bacterium]